MWRFARLVDRVRRAPASLLEVVGLALVAIGLHELNVPASLVFTGAALIVVAQGMERHE